MAIPFNFTCPEIARAGGTKLETLITAALSDDAETLALMRAAVKDDADAFDGFVASVRGLSTGDYTSASCTFAPVKSNWHVSATILRTIALAASGEFREAIALSNQIGEVIKASGKAGAASYAGDDALLRESVRCLQLAEGACPTVTGPVRMESLFRYVVGYPRSGNTLLTQFLSFAFEAPNYSVYPGAGRYFSLRFHEPAPGHAVFVKDHVLRSEYLENKILSPVRDGRDATVSLARYLYAEGSNQFIRRGELADFLSFVAERMPYGFWGNHTRQLLEARDRGAQIRIVRYEEIFGKYQALLALARELADDKPVPCVDEESFNAFVAIWHRRLKLKPQWSEGLIFPEDSFIPQNWSIGKATIDWRRAFDMPARRRFHDLGGTDMLLRLGYESDENWWRQS